MYYGLFKKIVSYGVIAWRSAYENALNSLSILQNKDLKKLQKMEEMPLKSLSINNFILYQNLCLHYEKLENRFITSNSRPVETNI